MAEQQVASKGKIVVVRIKGRVRLNEPIERTLKMLHLHRKNYCALIEDTPSNKGMIVKVKDFVTWGTLDEATIKDLDAKRQQTTKNKNGKEEKKSFYRLHPPRGGYGRKGTKVAFGKGGALGPRGEKISELIKRML